MGSPSPLKVRPKSSSERPISSGRPVRRTRVSPSDISAVLSKTWISALSSSIATILPSFLPPPPAERNATISS